MSTYTGPSVREMIASQSMAENIIKYHDGPSQNQIFDDSELKILQRFVNHPEQRDDILRGVGIEAGPPSTSNYNGSLAGYVVLRHGYDDILSEQEIARLKEWFANGDVFEQ